MNLIHHIFVGLVMNGMLIGETSRGYGKKDL
jgi:hypothetical protein